MCNNSIFEHREGSCIMSKMKDNAYYEYVYNHFGGIVYATAYHILKNQSMAQEVLQETFCTFFKYNSRLRESDEKTINKWLRITSRNISIDLLRKQNIHLDYEDEIYIDTFEEKETDPELVAIKNEDIALLSKAIDELDIKYSKIIRMKYYDDLSANEISMLLGISVFTVYTRIRRGLKKLKEVYERWERDNEDI